MDPAKNTKQKFQIYFFENIYENKYCKITDEVLRRDSQILIDAFP